MRIRTARLDDAPSMARVFVDSFHTAHRDQLPAHLLETRTYAVSEAGWRRSLTDPDPAEHVAVAESADGILGLAMCGPAGPWPPGSPTSAPTGELYALYVDPSHQGRGIGRALFADAADFLTSKGFQHLHVGVLTANQPARAFYEALGGTVLGERPHLDEGIALAETVYLWPGLTTPG